MNAHLSDAEAKAATPTELPRGSLALVFTDIESSTRLLQALGSQYAEQLAAHRRILRACFAAHCGVEVDAQGDAFFAVFREINDAIRAVVRAQRELHAYPWPAGFPLRVRIGLHCGEPTPTAEGYVGLDLHRCARLMSAGHGGQILLSGAAANALGANALGALDSSLELRDLGEHQLKDLAQPQRIFELRVAGLPADFAPLRTIDNRPHNLPPHLAPIVGRAREVAQLRAQLEAGANLITLLGPGGTGKTRLSLAVGAATRDLWPDGVFFVPLAPIAAQTDQSARAEIEAEIAGAVARALGLRDDGSQTLAQRLIRHLKERQILLLLDNFEHLIGGATVVATWRERCPKLAILATSRIPLHLCGERQFPVSPLALPQNAEHAPAVAALSRFGALALFVERARAVRPDFELNAENAPIVAQICARLDGLPLAIELAAARIKMLPPHALLKRLDDGLNFLTGCVRDGLAHHQTLRAAIAWSYDLLSDDEQALFRRLAVFRGGFGLEGAEQVCGADVFEGVSSLLDQSLLMWRDEIEGAPRFLMLETIRQFALEALVKSGESDALHARHLRWCQRVTDERNAAMRGDFGRALRLFRADADNWRAAWNWALETRPADALRLASSSALLWNRAGSTPENYQRLETALRRAPNGDIKHRCRALQYLIQMDRNRANWNCYRAHLEQLETLAHEFDLPEFRALALDQRMWDAVGARDSQGALQMGETITQLRRHGIEAARLARADAREVGRLEDELHDAMILHVEILVGAGRHDEAWTLMDETLALKRASGDEGGLTFGLHKYAQMLAQSGSYGEALAVSREVVARAQNSGDRSLMLAYYFHEAAQLALRAGELALARGFIRQSYAVFKEDNAELGFLLTLRALAHLHEAEGNWIMVARIVGALGSSHGAQTFAFEPEDAYQNAAQHALGDAEFKAQYQLGARLNWQQSVEMAL